MKITIDDTTNACDVVAQADVACVACSDVIPKDTPCVWVEQAGTFHRDCVEMSSASPEGAEKRERKPSMAKSKKADDRIQFDTRRAHETLLAALDMLEKSLERAAMERQVEIGSVLWDFDDRVREVLDKIKVGVREEAVARLKGQVGRTIIEGDDMGEATVRIVEAGLRVPKGVNVEDVKHALGADFDLFFEETVTIKPRKEFEERVTAVTSSLHQQVLHNAVERVEHTPRVSFRRHKPSKRDSG